MDYGPRFELVRGARTSRRATMASEVRAGLGRSPRNIPPKYFYDEVGSRLFDAICELPEYYLTRAERALLVTHADGVIERAQASSLIEIGSGMARKTGLLVRALCLRVASPTYVPFDIAPEALGASARVLLSEHPTLRVRAVVGDFAHDCSHIARGAPASAGPRLFAFLGSTIGNLDESEAPALLRSLADVMAEPDRFLLGIDLVKDTDVLHAAYNDAQGITAQFNKNVLRVLAHELDADLDDSAFEHLARYDEALQRIEMYLVSTRPQTITFRAADVCVTFAPGERVLTEISRKFTRASVEHTLAEGGMQMLEWMVGEDQQFALCLARKV